MSCRPRLGTTVAGHAPDAILPRRSDALNAFSPAVVVDASSEGLEKLVVGRPSSTPLDERLRRRKLVLGRSVTKPLLLIARRRRRLLAYPFIELLILHAPNLELDAKRF